MDPLFTTALTVFGVLGAAYLTNRVSNRKLKTDSGQQLIDQHQEDNAALRRDIADLRRINRIQDDYIGHLRRHIADGRPPPPPDWPDGLTT